MNYQYDLQQMVDLLEAEQKLEEFIADIFHFQMFCADNYGISEFLLNAHLPMASKLKHLDKYIKPYVGQSFYQFLQQLTVNEDITHYPAMDKRILEVIEKKLNCEFVEIVSAELLSLEQTKSIRGLLEKISGRRIFTYNSISPRIIGGFVLNYRERTIDLSIQGDLEKIRTELMYQK
jgi:ATP synthase F1 delta subunit